ncbi:MAG TPA: ribokinase [Candidatus Limnocylindria bacterium]
MTPAGGGRVLVVGAINMDLVVSVPHLPGPGETMLGGDLARHPGGKGANQAVAAARMGAPTVMVGCLGRDEDGEHGLHALREDGVDVRSVLRTDAPSGAALIVVAADGSNQIAVAPGANARLDARFVEAALHDLAPGGADVLLVSLEVPMDAVAATVRATTTAGSRVVLNPAPAQDLPPDLLAAGPILTPNRRELARLAGVDGLESAARSLLERGARAVVVTLGEDGCAVYDADGHEAYNVLHGPVVDTTGAGDCFNGVLAAELARGSALRDGAARANRAAGLSVRAAGARAGMPTRAALVD